jgi:ketosteroid isomerase-like protein
MKNTTELPIEFWNHFNNREWDLAEALLSEDFEAVWPQSREKIVGPKNFIEVNRIYPGTHKIEILDSHQSYDNWEHIHQVRTEVYIESKMPDGKEMKLFAVSFFEVSDEKIVSIKEYWADTYPAPEWRSHLVERY